MADAFSYFDARSLLKNKHILFLGDSNIRAQYKDLVWLLNSNTLVALSSLRSKLELSYLGDTLVHRSKLHRGRDFQEVRCYSDRNSRTMVDFMFIPRCFNNQLEDLFKAFRKRSKPVPDVIVMNSCLWDLCRWGPNGVYEYKDNMVKLMRMMNQSLPKECLVIWTTALPTAAHVRGGLMIKQIEFMEPMLRFEIMEANTFAREVVVNHGFDVLDNHYYNRMQMHRRAKDGVHYLPVPVRFMTNLILTHISLSWGQNLPNNISTLLLDKAIALNSKEKATSVKMPVNGIFSKLNLPSPEGHKARGLKITFNVHDEGGSSRKCKLLDKKEVKYYNKFHTPRHQYEIRPQQYCAEFQDSSHGNSRLPHHEDQQLAPVHIGGGPYRRRNRKKRKDNRKNPYQDNHYTYRY